YEVIVVDDGSTDSTAAIASSYGFRVISAAHVGLSQARNIGMEAATGEIIAYTDDDTRADPQWLSYLAALFMRTDHAGVGGPNIPQLGDDLVAMRVPMPPGGPSNVFLSNGGTDNFRVGKMPFGRLRRQKLADSTRSFARQVMTWMCAGNFRRAAGHWASARRRW